MLQRFPVKWRMVSEPPLQPVKQMITHERNQHPPPRKPDGQHQGGKQRQKETLRILPRMNPKLHILPHFQILEPGETTTENHKIMPFLPVQESFRQQTIIYYHILLFIQKSNIAKDHPTTGQQAHLVTTKRFQSRRRRKRDSPAMLPEIPWNEIKLLFDDYGTVQFRFTKTVVRIALRFLHETFRGNFILFD